jgi:hypothetical protein
MQIFSSVALNKTIAKNETLKVYNRLLGVDNLVDQLEDSNMLLQ